MNTWNELVSAALVGTERRAFAPDPAIGADDPAQALLRQAVLSTIPALTGAQPAPYEGPVPEPAPADDRPLIPGAVRLRLRAVLDVYAKYLAEWLEAVRAAGLRVPLAAMPGLLDAGRQNVACRGALAEVLGARGHWLARQNPDWRYLLREPFGPLRPEDWDGPDPDARIAYANGLYATDPDAARELFRAAWPTLTAAAKVALLGLVSRHGTKDDLPFLKGLANDSSKQVRDEARPIEGYFERREKERSEYAPETFTADVERLAATEQFSHEFYRFATRRAHYQWPLDGSRVLLAALVEFSRGNDAEPGDQAARRRRSNSYYAAGQLLNTLADLAPVELRPDVERVVQAQLSDTAAGAVHELDFTDLLTPLGFRADMHAELTASDDAAPGQE